MPGIVSANAAFEAPLYSKTGEFAVRSIAGETILVPVQAGVGDLDSIFVLNDTASVVWRELDSAPSVGRIVEAVLDAFEVSREEAERDVEQHLSSLEGAGLITRAGGRA